MKIILVILYIVMLFTGDNVGSLIVGIFFLLIAYPVSKIPMKMVAKGVKPVIPIILFTAVLNMLFVDGKVLWSWWAVSYTHLALNALASGPRSLSASCWN